ncbi:MAG: alpha/beta hydrolase [Desulfohalobiaceae bacterium]
MLWGLYTVVGLYLTYVLALTLLQRRLMFPGAPLAPSDAPPGVKIDRFWINTEKASCEAWFMPPSDREGPSPTIIFAHGNAERIEEWVMPFESFTSMGFGVLLVEYPGYGRSRGAPTQRNITRIMTQAFDTLAAREDVDAERIIAMGRSIGGGAVCRIPTDRPAAMVLTSTFTSIRAFARSFLFPPFLVLDPYNNIAALSAYTGPVLLQHGLHDKTVPATHAKALARASGRSRVLLEECGHNDCPPDWPTFCKQVREFLRTNHVLSDEAHHCQR